MTSNIGSEWFYSQKPQIGFAVSDENGQNEENTGVEDAVRNELKRHFKPEFLNRIDEIVVFHGMSKEMLSGIIEILLDEVRELLQKKNISVEFDASLKEALLTEGYDPQFGARPLKRAITKLIINPLSEKMLAGEL